MVGPICKLSRWSGSKRQGNRYILCVVTLLSLSIAALVIFSAGFSTNKRPKALYLVGLIISNVLVSIFMVCLPLAHKMKAKEDVKLALDAKEHELDADTEFLKTLTGLPTRFTFKELESATANFGLKLGRGGFGSVYEGILSDGCKVAVKRLEREGHGQKEFCAEVATISRVRHLNLVFLKGFCVEGAERLLVYEYMSGGSLDRWIFQDKTSASDSVPAKFIVLSWKTRFDIALDIARGLTYLHEECEEKILHLDIKPQNILLDTKFHAKLSDFGLSRSMDRAQSRVLTTMRGTPGYLAPEWFNDEGIDIKADVYGYGMVLLELVSGRRSVDQSQSNPENWYLPTMAFKKVQNKAALELVDPMLIGTLDAADCHQIVMSVNIALWCIQDKVSLRPKMSTVVQMLDGSISVEDPPCSSMLMSKQRLPLSSVSNITVVDAETISIPR